LEYAYIRAQLLAAVLALVVLGATFASVFPVAAEGATPGDVNSDGRVNSIDALFLLYYRAGIICALPPPEESGCPISQLGKGDVNEDGAANALDATLILQFHAGLLSTLPP